MLDMIAKQLPQISEHPLDRASLQGIPRRTRAISPMGRRGMLSPVKTGRNGACHTQNVPAVSCSGKSNAVRETLHA
jgi:hypothetical protein